MIITACDCNIIKICPLADKKSSRHIRLDILNRFVKGISPKIVRRCHTEKRVFGPTINPNSKLCEFISVLINPTPKCRFFDPTVRCDCLLLVEYVQGGGAYSHREFVTLVTSKNLVAALLLRGT